MFGTLINLLFLNNLIKGFYMKGIRALCLWFLLLPAGVASAQLVEKVLDVFNDDTLGTVVAQRADTDSVHLLKMKEDLEVARLNEANLRMEIEQMRLKYDAADSLKLAKQRLRIDSLRRAGGGGRRYAILPVCQAWWSYSAATCRNECSGNNGAGQAI